MNILPPLPPWNGMHPIAVHLPLGVLMVVPALLVLAMLARKSGRAFGAAALVLLIIGTAGAFLAVITGEAAADIADGSSGYSRVMDEHEELGELTRNLFLGLAALYAILLAVAAIMKQKMKRTVWVIANAAVLVLHSAALIPLFNTGHLGGKLVHEHGVRAPLTPTGGAYDPDTDEFVDD